MAQIPINAVIENPDFPMPERDIVSCGTVAPHIAGAYEMGMFLFKLLLNKGLKLFLTRVSIWHTGCIASGQHLEFLDFF